MYYKTEVVYLPLERRVLCSLPLCLHAACLSKEVLLIQSRWLVACAAQTGLVHYKVLSRAQAAGSKESPVGKSQAEALVAAW